MKSTIEPLLISQQDVSRLTGLGLSTTKALIARGKIASIKIGRRRMIPRAELERYIASQLAATAA